MPGFVHGTSRFFTFPAAAASATIEKEPSPAGTPTPASAARCSPAGSPPGTTWWPSSPAKTPRATASAAHAAMARTLTEALRPLLPPDPGKSPGVTSHNSGARHGGQGMSDAKRKAQGILDVYPSTFSTQMACNGRCDVCQTVRCERCGVALNHKYKGVYLWNRNSSSI